MEVVDCVDEPVPAEQWDAEVQQMRISDALARRNIEERRALRAMLAVQCEQRKEQK
jgi:hypothetical protein